MRYSECPKFQCSSVKIRGIRTNRSRENYTKKYFSILTKSGMPPAVLLPHEYNGPRYRVKVGQRPDGRPDPPPPNHAEKRSPNLMRVYLVRAQVSGSWEERPGPAPANEDEDYSETIIRINLVEAKHGQHEPAEAEA